MAKVGIYSGIFDPVHKGHVSFAKQAMEQCSLDKVFFLVEPRPRRKQGVRALEHRLRMVQIAIKDEPRFGLIVLEQARFTVSETLPLLRSRFKGSDIYFLMGDDMLNHFNDTQWPHIDEFVKALKLIIGVRKRTVREVKEQVKLIERTRGVSINHEIFKSNEPSPSSTEVRTSLRKGILPKEIDEEVYKYIQSEKLYTSGADS